MGGCCRWSGVGVTRRGDVNLHLSSAGCPSRVVEGSGMNALGKHGWREQIRGLMNQTLGVCRLHSPAQSPPTNVTDTLVHNCGNHNIHPHRRHKFSKPTHTAYSTRLSAPCYYGISCVEHVRVVDRHAHRVVRAGAWTIFLTTV